MVSYVLSHDQGTIREEKGCMEMCDFHMAAMMYLTGHGLKARAHALVKITHFPMRSQEMCDFCARVVSCYNTTDIALPHSIPYGK